MDSKKFQVNEDQGVQYIYERAEFEAKPKRKPFQKALLTLGFLGITAGASAVGIGQFSGGLGNEASADTEVANVASASSATQSSTAAPTTTTATAASSSSQAAKITLPTVTKSFGSSSHSTQKTSGGKSVSFGGGEREGGDD